MQVVLRMGAALLAGLAAPAAAEPWTLRAAVGAPEALTLRGSARVRYETLSGQYREGLDRDDELLTFRTRIFAEYDLGAVAVGGELQDSRAYLGDRGGAVGPNDVNALELLQAYVALDVADARLKLGRMVLNLGSGRLSTDDDFRNATNGFTGARLDWKGQGGRAATLFYTLPQQRLPDDKASLLDNEVRFDRESFDQRFWGGIYERRRPGRIGVNLYVFGLDERDSARRRTRNRHLVTPGARIWRAPARGATDFEVEGAWQFGSARATDLADDRRDRDVSAWFVHSEIGRTFDIAWSPRLAVGYDHVSGDRASTDRIERFDTLFGSRRGDFAPSGIYGAIGRANLSSPVLRIEVAPDRRTDATLSWRPFRLDARRDAFSTSGVRDRSGRAGRFAGNQIEGRLRRWLVPGLLRAEAGGALLLRGRFLKEAPNATRNGDTAYLYMDLAATF